MGGSPADLHVKHIRARCFSFEVCSKPVGLWVCQFISSSCKDFSLRFFLWRNGGPNWWREFDSWCRDQEKEWTLLSHKKQPLPASKPCDNHSFAEVVDGRVIPVKSVFQHLMPPLLKGKLPCSSELPSSSTPAMVKVAVRAEGTRDAIIAFLLNSDLNCVCCLSMGHLRVNSTGPLCCRACHHPGHLARFCHKSGPIKAQKTVELSTPKNLSNQSNFV